MPFILSNMPSAWRSRSPSMRRAGNLFGTTRRFQFALLWRPFSPVRYARISGGVLASLPGQNGQKLADLMSARSREKSLGRLERSVEMITQRPVMGSFRSSGTRISYNPCSGCENVTCAAGRICWLLFCSRQSSVNEPRKRSNSLVESLPLMLPAQAK